MSTHNAWFYGELEKIIPQLSPKYSSLTSPLLIMFYMSAVLFCTLMVNGANDMYHSEKVLRSNIK